MHVPFNRLDDNILHSVCGHCFSEKSPFLNTHFHLKRLTFLRKQSQWGLLSPCERIVRAKNDSNSESKRLGLFY